MKNGNVRIDEQFEPDGSQPLENVRTRSLHYCDFNNRAMLDIARLAKPLGVDLWSYGSSDGRSIRKSLDYQAPYMTGDNKDWPHIQIEDPHTEWFAQSFRWAGICFNDPTFEAKTDQRPDRFGDNSWIELVVPAL